MRYIYHKVPQDMEGKVICPLNILKEKYSDINKAKAEKYENRQELSRYRIENLDCAWGDVVFMTSVHPENLQVVFESCGFKDQIKGNFYQIPVGDLDRDNLLIMEPQMRLPKGKDFISFDEALLRENVSDGMIEYLIEKKRESGNPLLYAFVQHVLYKGCIDVSEVGIISL